MSTGGGGLVLRWVPVEGPETRALLDSQTRLSPAGRAQLLAEAQRVLGQCVPPSAPPETDTGLAIGFVQSGKTLNFTTVTALARDNGYPLIIVIAGTSVHLFDQSTDRLIDDLGITTRRGARRWRHVPNPKDTDVDSVRSVLDNWRPGSTVPEARRQSVLITVMKQHQRLDGLIDLLQELDLDGVPVLIIDDEADQAGLNNEVNVPDRHQQGSRNSRGGASHRKSLRGWRKTTNAERSNSRRRALTGRSAEIPQTEKAPRKEPSS